MNVNQELAKAGSLSKPPDKAKHKDFLKGNRIETAGENKINTPCEPCSDETCCWRTELFIQCLLSAFGWTISFADAPLETSYSLLFSGTWTPLRSHLREVIKQKAVTSGLTTALNSPHSTSAEGLVRLRPWWAQSLFSEVLPLGSIVRTELIGGDLICIPCSWHCMVTMQTSCGP